MDRLAKAYLAKADSASGPARGTEGDRNVFRRHVGGHSRRRAGPAGGRAEALQGRSSKFAERAYRRPLRVPNETTCWRFITSSAGTRNLGHDEAAARHPGHRADVASFLLPRRPRAEPGTAVRPLSDYELASRLSYFLWSSMPDAELLAHAAAGDLHQPNVLTAQARRMLRDPRVRGLATEFAGNWLDFRRFEEHNSVDRERFPSFTNELRQAMFEEPIRYFIDIAQRNRSVLDLLYGNDTFVNRSLAQALRHVRAAEGSGRMGPRRRRAAPSAAAACCRWRSFSPRTAPGLRTSPVKRGYWVVRRLLGEQIPPPPPTVPQLPKDEAKLGDADAAASPRAAPRRQELCRLPSPLRFDRPGLRGLRPDRRTPRPGIWADTRPDRCDLPRRQRAQGAGGGCANICATNGRIDFVDNLCRKLFIVCAGPRLAALRQDMHSTRCGRRLAADDTRSAVWSNAIVTSPQFLNKRGATILGHGRIDAGGMAATNINRGIGTMVHNRTSSPAARC